MGVGVNLKTIDNQYEDVTINDRMRFLHGDGPAAAFEAGNQKGGHYFCPSCDVHSGFTDNISYSYQSALRSLEDIRQRVLQGDIGKKRSMKKVTCPFEKLTACDLQKELSKHKVDFKGKSTIKDLSPMLKLTLKGTKRVPILLFYNPSADLEHLNLSFYEVAMLEPMHDIAGHIENILTELPHHMRPKDKELFDKCFSICIAERQRRRCCDWRKFLLVMTLYLDGIDGKVLRLLKTLSEVQRILYLRDDERTALEVLRLHNSCFEHYILMKEIFSGKLIGLTRERLYGKYMHNLLVHAPIQYRVVSGDSINTEDEERQFNEIKNICRGTTNNKPGHFIGNIIVRMKCESSAKQKFDYVKSIDNTVRELNMGNHLVKHRRNSLFEYKYIQKHFDDWQSHLQRIADFLSFGENIWWEKNDFGVEFFDVPDNQPKCVVYHPKIHHFRSSHISTVTRMLEDHWSTILKNNTPIPTHKVLIGDLNDIPQIMETTFLSGKVESIDLPVILNSSLVNETVECTEDGLQEECNDLENFTFNVVVDESNALCEEPPLSIRDNEIEHTSEPTECNAQSNERKLIPSCGDSGSSFNIDFKATSFDKDAIKSKVALNISVVLGEVIPLVRQYSCMKTSIKLKEVKGNRLKETMNNCQDMLAKLQQKVLEEVGKLELKSENWERSFLVNNDMSLPTVNDRKEDPYAADIFRRLKIGKILLKHWTIAF